MAKVKVRAFSSPTLILLAFDWVEGKRHGDFLGFAVRRDPGYSGYSWSWVPNRIGFYGPSTRGRDFPSVRCPIQKFMWWDSRIETEIGRGRFRYTVYPVRGRPSRVHLVRAAGASIDVTLPGPVRQGIGTYFNRAVVSSQAFAKKFGRNPTTRKVEEALVWLANGIEKVVPGFLERSAGVEGAIYHLTDEHWVLPALASYRRGASIVYDARDGANEAAVEELGRNGQIELLPRKKAKIMHNKFLVEMAGGQPVAVLTGSANFTTAGLTTQANVLHTIRSPKLAGLYRQRKKLLENDPTLGSLAKKAGWSSPVSVGKSRFRVFFSPEKKPLRGGIDAVVQAVEKARSSVVFCLFSPTDKALRDALFAAGDDGKMMFGLINAIPKAEPKRGKEDAGGVARVEIFHRSKSRRDVYAHALYARAAKPFGFWWESTNLPGGARQKFPVYIHHKFVIIDAETDAPTIYTGSANMSNASSYNNDENLLEIKNNPALAQMYLCEFMRLYEHYRARAAYERWRARKGNDRAYRLAGDSRWAERAFTEGTPEFKCRTNMVHGL